MQRAFSLLPITGFLFFVYILANAPYNGHGVFTTSPTFYFCGMLSFVLSFCIVNGHWIDTLVLDVQVRGQRLHSQGPMRVHQGLGVLYSLSIAIADISCWWARSSSASVDAFDAPNSSLAFLVSGTYFKLFSSSTLGCPDAILVVCHFLI